MNLTLILATQLLKGSGTPVVVVAPKLGSVLGMKGTSKAKRSRRSRRGGK